MGKSPRKQPRSGANRRQSVLQDRLVRLWRKLAAVEQPPAIDRFLARELGRLDGLSRRDRLWLGDILTDSLRFGTLTLFAELWRRDGWRAEASLDARLASHPLPSGPALWRQIGRLPVPIVFFWTFMRKRLTGSELPPIAAPGPDAAEVWRALKEQAPTHSAPAVRALWAGLSPALIPLLHERAEISGWRDQEIGTFLDQHAARPPVWLRLLRRDALPRLQTELETAGFSARVTGRAVSARGERGVFELPSYRDGTIEIQDLASQGIGDAVGAKAGELVWDCCAGAGGKSIQLAALMSGRGIVHATDLHESKLKDLGRRAARAGLANIQSRRWDGETVPDFGPEVRANGGFDRVLVDAPCSGSGTWRRNVDGRLRFDPAAPNHWTSVQTRLLNLAATGVRAGGRLVYATCSWLPAENEQVCRAFAATHPDWRLVDMALMGNPGADCDTTFRARFTHRQAAD